MALMAITPHINDLENFLSHAHRRKFSNKTTVIHEGINLKLSTTSSVDQCPLSWKMKKVKKQLLLI